MGVSAPMFSRRRHILAGLQCAKSFQIDVQLCIPTHTEHEIENHAIMAIMASEAGPKNSKVHVGGRVLPLYYSLTIIKVPLLDLRGTKCGGERSDVF